MASWKTHKMEKRLGELTASGRTRQGKKSWKSGDLNEKRLCRTKCFKNVIQMELVSSSGNELSFIIGWWRKLSSLQVKINRHSETQLTSWTPGSSHWFYSAGDERKERTLHQTLGPANWNEETNRQHQQCEITQKATKLWLKQKLWGDDNRKHILNSLFQNFLKLNENRYQWTGKEGWIPGKPDNFRTGDLDIKLILNDILEFSGRTGRRIFGWIPIAVCWAQKNKTLKPDVTSFSFKTQALQIQEGSYSQLTDRLKYAGCLELTVGRDGSYEIKFKPGKREYHLRQRKDVPSRSGLLLVSSETLTGNWRWRN